MYSRSAARHHKVTQCRYVSDSIIYMKPNLINMENIKIYLLKLLLNNIFKYNESECREKWLETTIDDIKFLIEE